MKVLAGMRSVRGIRGKGLLVALAACVPFVLAAPALANPPTIVDGNGVPALNALESQGKALLDAHLSPGLTIPVEIGWQADIPADEKSPATANPFHGGFSLGGHVFNYHYYCGIAVDQALFEADTGASGDDLTGGNLAWEQEIITHEMFHCYEMQIVSESAFPTMTQTEPWLMEGLARWVDVTLFSSNPIGVSALSLIKYFSTPSVSLTSRSYDAVGFWGHRQDVVGDLWSRIPDILSAGQSGSQAAVDAALAGVSPEDFFSTWGSSAANIPAGGAEWTATSPYPDGHYQSVPHAVGGGPAESTVSVPLDAYSTAQVSVGMPTPPAGDIETARIDLNGAYGRFGVDTNYTADQLKDLTFCSGGSQCSTTPPAAGSCPGGATPTPPQSSLTPLPDNPVLAVAAAKDSETVKIIYTPISATPASAGTCPPDTGSDSGDGGDDAGDGGDPHFTDFHGDLFDFQAAGQYTLLESTTDDLQIQARQVQIPHTSVAANNEVAMRDGKATVEVDATGIGRITAYVNKDRVGNGHHSLKGGGSLTVSGNDATVVWTDGTTVKLDNSVNGPNFGHLVACLWIDIKVASDRLGHLTGLLGDAGVPSSSEFASRGGTAYSAGQIVGGDTSILYGAFGTSWRVTSKKASLFRSTSGSNLHGFTLKGATSIFAELLKLLRTDIGRVQAAAKTCNKHEFVNGAAQDACEVDVAETGNAGFVTADAGLDEEGTQDIAASTPPPPPPPPPTPTPTAPALPASIVLGTGEDQPTITHDPVSGDTYVAWEADSNETIYECTLLLGAGSCANGGAAALTDSTAGAGSVYTHPQIVMLNGLPVVLAEVEAASANVEPNGSYDQAGVVAWKAPTTGATFAIQNSGKLLASDEGTGEPPSAGAVALGTTNIGVGGNYEQFGNGFTDFTLSTSASATTPNIDGSDSYGNQGDADGSQLAAIPDGTNNYLVVVVGGDLSTPPAACPTGTDDATGYAAATGTAATLATQAKWNTTTYFKPISCDATAPVLAGGASGIGLLEDEGPGLNGSGSDGVYYRPFNTSTMAFATTPVEVSDETSADDGADDLSVSQDSAGGIYGCWLDGRGIVLSYSANGSTVGSSWTTPFATGLDVTSGAGDAVVAGVGGASADIAYVAGDTEELQVVPAADTEFTP
jgi:hypothetical protein